MQNDSNKQQSKVDKDKLEKSLSEDHWNPGMIISEVKTRLTELKEITDLLAKSTASKVSNVRLKTCQDLLSAYETTLFAYGDVKKIGALSNSQQREILVMVDDIVRGKREAAHFQLNRNCDGIKELFSNKVFTFKNQENESDS